MKKLALIFATILMIGCKTSNSVNDKTTAKKESTAPTIDYKVVGKSEYGGRDKQSYIVIGTSEEFKILTLEVGIEDAPEIDFTNKMAVIIFLGLRNSGGYSIDVDSVYAKETSLMIKTKTTSPSGMATTAMTNPYVIVEVPVYEEVIVEF